MSATRIPDFPGELDQAVNPYDGTPSDAASVIPPSGYVPPTGPPTEADAKAALLELANRGQLGYAGRWCSACHSDLGAVGVVQPMNKFGFKESTGQEYDGRAWPQGGHDAKCPVPCLLEWLDGKPTPFTRRRPAEVPA